MILDPEFLAILVCPVTRQPLREADAAELSRINDRIARGGVRNDGGQPVAEPLEGALVVAEPGASGVVLYPIRTGIPVLLAAEAIRVDADAAPR